MSFLRLYSLKKTHHFLLASLALLPLFRNSRREIGCGLTGLRDVECSLDLPGEKLQVMRDKKNRNTWISPHLPGCVSQTREEHTKPIDLFTVPASILPIRRSTSASSGVSTVEEVTP